MKSDENFTYILSHIHMFYAKKNIKTKLKHSTLIAALIIEGLCKELIDSIILKH